MKIKNLFKKTPPPTPPPTAANSTSRPRAEGRAFTGLDDPNIGNYIRTGETAITVTDSSSLKNAAVSRCISIISGTIGMLPLNLIESGSKKAVATEHSLYRVLKRRPNGWQTAYDFKSYMQLKLLQKGNAYARIVRSRGEVIGLIPINPDKMTVRQDDYLNLTYSFSNANGDYLTLGQKDILHLRYMSEDTILGISLLDKAKDAIQLALQAEQAARVLFKEGVMPGSALTTEQKLSDPAYERLKTEVNDNGGSENAGKTLILEEGLKFQILANSAKDGQHLENRNMQIEEIARIFGVPRPLLMMDDTSWGSGMEQLGLFFVQFGLQQWFTIWEEAINFALLAEEEQETYYAKFNEKALLRGTLSSQADFFTKALGSGGQMPWLTANEVRDIQDIAKIDDERADKIIQVGQ